MVKGKSPDNGGVILHFPNEARVVQAVCATQDREPMRSRKHAFNRTAVLYLDDVRSAPT
jgi:hypothetical protein